MPVGDLSQDTLAPASQSSLPANYVLPGSLEVQPPGQSLGLYEPFPEPSQVSTGSHLARASKWSASRFALDGVGVDGNASADEADVEEEYGEEDLAFFNDGEPEILSDRDEPLPVLPTGSRRKRPLPLIRPPAKRRAVLDSDSESDGPERPLSVPVSDHASSPEVGDFSFEAYDSEAEAEQVLADLETVRRRVDSDAGAVPNGPAYEVQQLDRRMTFLDMCRHPGRYRGVTPSGDPVDVRSVVQAYYDLPITADSKVFMGDGFELHIGDGADGVGISLRFNGRAACDMVYLPIAPVGDNTESDLMDQMHVNYMWLGLSHMSFAEGNYWYVSRRVAPMDVIVKENPSLKKIPGFYRMMCFQATMRCRELNLQMFYRHGPQRVTLPDGSETTVLVDLMTETVYNCPDDMFYLIAKERGVRQGLLDQFRSMNNRQQDIENDWMRLAEHLRWYLRVRNTNQNTDMSLYTYLACLGLQAAMFSGKRYNITLLALGEAGSGKSTALKSMANILGFKLRQDISTDFARILCAAVQNAIVCLDEICLEKDQAKIINAANEGSKQTTTTLYATPSAVLALSGNGSADKMRARMLRRLFLVLFNERIDHTTLSRQFMNELDEQQESVIGIFPSLFMRYMYSAEVEAEQSDLDRLHTTIRHMDSFGRRAYEDSFKALVRLLHAICMTDDEIRTLLDIFLRNATHNADMTVGRQARVTPAISVMNAISHAFRSNGEMHQLMRAAFVLRSNSRNRTWFINIVALKTILRNDQDALGPLQEINVSGDGKGSFRSTGMGNWVMMSENGFKKAFKKHNLAFPSDVATALTPNARQALDRCLPIPERTVFDLHDAFGFELLALKEQRKATVTPAPLPFTS